MTSKKQPSNNGQRWSAVEDALLFDELEKAVDLATIAKKHGRTVASIIARRDGHAITMLKDNIKVECIMSKLHINQKEMDEIMLRISTSADALSTEIKELRREIEILKASVKEIYDLLS